MLVSIMCAATGAIMIAVGIPLAKRKVPPNHTYGLRTSATLGDERVWYEANARSGIGFILGGVFIILGAVVSLFLNVSETLLAIGLLGMVIVTTILLCVDGWRFANRISK